MTVSAPRDAVESGRPIVWDGLFRLLLADGPRRVSRPLHLRSQLVELALQLLDPPRQIVNQLCWRSTTAGFLWRRGLIDGSRSIGCPSAAGAAPQNSSAATASLD